MIIGTRARLLELVARRAQLQHRAQAERERLAALVTRGDGALSWVYKGQRMLQALGRRPLIVVAVVALLVALRPGRSLKWMARGWGLWRLYRQVRDWRQHLEAAIGVQPARRPG